MSGSDWTPSDSGSDSDEAASALNARFVESLSQSHPPRVTQRRRRRHSPAISDAEKDEDEAVGTDPPPRKPPRLDLVAMISAALKKDDGSCLPSEASVGKLAAKIVEALRESSGGGEVARAVTQALADPLNVELRKSVLQGKITPTALVAMDEVSLLNPKDRERQERARLDRLNQHSVEYLEKLQYTVTHMFTCPACGSHECFANFRSTDFVKWQGDDQTPTLLRCCKCSHSFRQ